MQLFCSRDRQYRCPTGAVVQDTEIWFRICLPRTLGCRGAFLCHCADGGMEQLDGMFWAGMEGDDHEWWDCRYTPEQPNLYWYSFVLDTDGGRRYLCCQEDGTAALSEQKGRQWQLTCYEKGFTTPDWLVGGVMYQVFPDRFACSGQSKEGDPADRVMREDWGGQPVWRPDENGIVRNNDFFGGDLRGISEKLPYLQSLGVTCLYLNPIFEAHSNHRYDTANYSRIDPLLGNEEDFRALADKAKECGIRIMLDGVFSHTGADSIYFNKNGRYDSEGAYQSLTSPYASWYHFSRWPDKYTGWWGFNTLPEVDELNEAFLSYITGEGGILQHWLKVGASGWRLDVADELPDGFLEALRTSVKRADPDAMVLGEVWEDASNKHSYGHRRRYLLGRQLDSVMNYPFRQAILDFLRGGDATQFFNRILTVVENYPPQVTRILMNSLGTHDTERVITLLAGEPTNGRGRNWQAQQHLSGEQRAWGLRLLKLATVLQYTIPGVPCVYYGDEAGMEGYQDPFNRGCYPWGDEDRDLVEWYQKVGTVRKECDCLREGDFRPLFCDGGVMLFERRSEQDALLCAVNRNSWEAVVALPEEWVDAALLMGGGTVKNGLLHLPAADCLLQKQTFYKKTKKVAKRC